MCMFGELRRAKDHWTQEKILNPSQARQQTYKLTIEEELALKAKMGTDKIPVTAMKQYLPLRGLRVSGNKKELVERIILHEEGGTDGTPIPALAFDCIE